ncbi:phosphatidylserine lipase ABHD16A [Halyomorpha halys]|uniref:phosphatidylserine lipase ABHD16A n=1 Tax=Halyomorpha halys TaxID=286706 RepID=UPI0006D4E45D|nr:protein ABHD16A isoform X1 [Halyomorpha halys]
MSHLKMFFKCFNSPSLHMIYQDPNFSGRYVRDRWERLGDFSLNCVVIFWKLSIFTTPLIAIFFYRRGYMNMDGVVSLTKMTLWFGLLIGASFCLRSYGRASNAQYRFFLEKLNNAATPTGLGEIKKFDFDFEAWPVEFHLPIRTSKKVEPRKSMFSSIISSPCSIIGYLVLHTVGIRMIYPGSITLLNMLLSSALIDGRKSLVSKNGQRFKLRTPEGNTVDTMLIDKRNITGNKKGNMLILCSEGNAGFYENGIMGTPIEAGFSVLGWNHPGFGCSTGLPFVNDEEGAINTVMEFAINKLGFSPEQIILYGWSIGGFASSWAAEAYPNVRAVVLDATFDDVLPLALNQMPNFLDSIVRVTIRSYADLNVARLLLNYPGLIKLIRRADDEIISIIPGDISTNRGNDLLKKVMKRRYPNIISDEVLTEWLSKTGSEQRRVADENNVNLSLSRQMIDSYIYDHGPSFPFTELGKNMDDDIKAQLTIYLAGEYMKDYASTHCVPLPSQVFQELLESIL